MNTVSQAYEYWYTWGDNYPFGSGDMTYGATRSEAKMNAFRKSECDDFKEIFNMRLKRRKDFDLVENTPHELVASLTKEAQDKMLHAIGRSKDAEPYRNRYVVEHDEDFEKLIGIGLATKAIRLDMNVYFLTDLGIKVIQSTQPIQRFRL